MRRQCELLGVNRSGLYYQPVGESAENLTLMRLIDEEYTRHPFYGTRRMKPWLLEQGYVVNRKRIARLMELMGLEAVYPKPQLSQARPGHKIYPYLLNGVAITRVNQVWSTDITYIRMAGGFVYLVAVMDWYSRYVVSWRLSNTLEGSFCCEALEEALSRSRPERYCRCVCWANASDGTARRSDRSNIADFMIRTSRAGSVVNRWRPGTIRERKAYVFQLLAGWRFRKSVWSLRQERYAGEIVSIERTLPLEDLAPRPTRSHFRWYICALLFFSTTINYVDRQLFANLIPYFEDELRIGPMDLARINVSFMLAYGLGMIFVGRFIDRVGTRIGLAITFLVWNLASAGHALVYSVTAFMVVRVILGLGEAGKQTIRPLPRLLSTSHLKPSCQRMIPEAIVKTSTTYATRKCLTDACVDPNHDPRTTAMTGPV